MLAKLISHAGFGTPRLQEHSSLHPLYAYDDKVSQLVNFGGQDCPRGFRAEPQYCEEHDRYPSHPSTHACVTRGHAMQAPVVHASTATAHSCNIM